MRLSQPNLHRARPGCLRGRVAATLLAACAAAALAACGTSLPAADPAAAPVPQVQDSAAAPAIAVAPSSIGEWINLGEQLAPWLSGYGPIPVAGASVPTRAAGLRARDGRWLAIIVAQRAPCSSSICTTVGPVIPATAPGDTPDLRWNADFDHWLEQQHTLLHHWLDDHGLGMSPRAWIGYRVDGAGSAFQSYALIDPTLIEPITRNNAEFLAASGPGLAWAHAFERATVAAARGGALDVPPFPFASQRLRTDEAEPEGAGDEAQAVQVPAVQSPAPQRKPQRDRN